MPTEAQYAAFGRAVLREYFDNEYELEIDYDFLQKYAAGMFHDEKYDPEIHGECEYHDPGDTISILNDDE